ncbi:MAG: YdaU family protein [Thiobacillus sp.]
MNYYERHLGDYAKDTVHLTMIEHGAYSVLLDRYYATECGIPADQVHRLARARTREEKQAVDSVLSDFFELIEGIWINHRAEEEIAKAQTKIKAAQENGKRGGRPRKNQTQTEQKPIGLFVGSENETQTKAHQAPDTRHHIKPIAGAIGIPDGGTPAGSICARLKNDGVQGVNPQNPKLLKLLEEGLTADEITAIGPEAASKGKGFAWVLAAAEGRRRDAAAVATLPAMPAEEWFLSASGIESKAVEHGITQQRDEPFPAFKARVYEAAGVTDDMVRRAKIDRGDRA